MLRIHQEDFCQATGFGPSRKYEAPNGPGLLAYARVLREHSNDLNEDRAALADFVAINYVSGSTDGHAKNNSLALRPDGTFVAPLYDLATGLAYDTNSPGGDREVAPSIGGRRQFGQVLPGALGQGR